MFRYWKKGDVPLSNEDSWAPYVGVYHPPTKNELMLIGAYLPKLALEEDEFVEDENESFVRAKKHYNSPNLRSHLIRFLRQIRESKGYDVEYNLGFFGTHFSSRSREDSCFQNEGVPGAQFAIKEINSLLRQSDTKITPLTGQSEFVTEIETEIETWKRYEFVTEIETWKRYEFVSLDKLVMSGVGLMLMTITALETDAEAMEIDDAIAHVDVDADDACLKTIQAMVHYISFKYQLIEWKFKPDPLT